VKYIPAWMPGGGFKRNARVWRQKASNILDLPFEEAKRRMVCFPLWDFRSIIKFYLGRHSF
ncbi:hypothetical protein M422DRAFT_169883, partial [Sphaerobolus stellatus SS14]